MACSGERARKKWRMSGKCSIICAAGSSSRQRGEVDDLLHGAPLYPCLRSGHGKQPVRPHSAGLFFGAEELWLGCGGVPDRGRVVQLAPPHPGPGICPREEWCVLSARAIATVIRSRLSHERSRRCRRRCAAPETGCSLAIITEKTPQRKGTLRSDSWLLWLLWLLWWLWFGLGDLTKCLWRYLSHACTINSGGRTPGRLTPVPATPSPP